MPDQHPHGSPRLGKKRSSTLRRPRRCPAFTLIELLYVVAVISVLIALLLPAVQQAREAARRTSCRNNLYQIGLAIQNYDSSFRMLPAGSIDPNRPIRSIPRGYHVGWALNLLPQFEQAALFRQYDFTKGVYDPANSTVRSAQINVFFCPSAAGGRMNYAGNHASKEMPIDVDNDGVFFLNSFLTNDELLDGVSHTLFVGEIAAGQSSDWIAGTRATLRNGGPLAAGAAPGLPAAGGNFIVADVGDDLPIGNENDPQHLQVGGFGSEHAGGFHALLGDGAVRFISSNINPAVLSQLCGRADGASAF
jgi:prepilin-type N-terminal cleavage/methylation domain-containing protein